MLGIGLASRQMRAVDFAMVVHAGFGDTAPFFLTLRFADIAWGKGIPARRAGGGRRLRVRGVGAGAGRVDRPDVQRLLRHDRRPAAQGDRQKMNLVGHRTQDENHCVWNGLWLKKYENGEKVKY